MLARFFTRSISHTIRKAGEIKPNRDFNYCDTLRTLSRQSIDELLTQNEKKLANNLEDNGLIESHINTRKSK